MLYSGMIGLPENIVLNVKNKSHAVTAQVVVPKDGARGVIVVQGGMFGGWSIYAKDGRPIYCYNLLGLQRFKIEGKTPIPAGEHQVRMEFAYDGGGLGKGGTVSLYMDGKKTGEGRIDRSTPMAFSLDDKTNVGSDRGTPVSDDYTCAGSGFNGRIDWIQIDLGEDAKKRRPPDHSGGEVPDRNGLAVTSGADGVRIPGRRHREGRLGEVVYRRQEV